MSTTSTTINFSAIDYKGINSLSSYALPLTPIRFIPDTSELALSANNSHRIVWDFGDGTLSKSFSTFKTYQFPGIYDVNMIVYDCNNNAQISTYTKSIQIFDYIPYTFNIGIDPNVYVLTHEGNYILNVNGNYVLYPNGSTINLELSTITKIPCGNISGPFSFTAYYPPYQPISNIYYSVSGSQNENYWDIVNDKFSHLNNFYALYDKQYNYSLSSYQYNELESIYDQGNDIYAKMQNDNIILCNKTDIGAYLVGRTFTKSVYIKSDKMVDNSIWKFFFDKKNNVLPFYTDKTDYLNNLAIQMNVSVIDNIPSRLSITSNGLDGEGYKVKSFDIHPIKYFDTKIPFVVKIKNNDNFSIKNYNPIELSALNIKVISLSSLDLSTEDDIVLTTENLNIIYTDNSGINLSSLNYSISSLNYTLADQSHGGSFRGCIYFPSSSSNYIYKNIAIQTSGTFINDKLSSYYLEGISTPFSLYYTDYYDLYKVNENFNASGTLKDLRFQESLFDDNVLFDNFLGGILGDENSNHDGIGLKLYEKTSNFVSNTQDIDDCEEVYINSLGQFMGYNDINEENYEYSEQIKRVINLASIDKSKLIGTSNKFKENLDIKGRTSKTEYGINIGDKINTSTYIVSAGVPIVALEKFSNTYNLLNTYQPVSAVRSFTYPLSSYTSDFGWPMVLPSDLIFKDIEKYYLFFNYKDKIDGTVVGAVVDFTNAKTTVDSKSTQDQLFGYDGIFQNMFMNTLYKSLLLIN